jgi:hypothetical protein
MARQTGGMRARFEKRRGRGDFEKRRVGRGELEDEARHARGLIHSVFSLRLLALRGHGDDACSTSWLKSKATGDWMRRRRLRR